MSGSRRLRTGHLFAGADAPERGESFEPLGCIGNVRIERIVSSSEPDSTLYDQVQDEWVLLVRGRARLRLDDRDLELGSGDYLWIPARTPHRVLETSPDALWLALHAEASASPEHASPEGEAREGDSCEGEGEEGGSPASGDAGKQESS